MDGLFWAAFAGDEDANALQQFGRRACAFGEEDVGAAGALDRKSTRLNSSHRR